MTPAGTAASDGAESKVPEQKGLGHRLAQTDRDRQILKLAPAVGFEPTTNRLTADRSTTELRWIKFFGRTAGIQFAQRIASGKFVSKSSTFDLVAGGGPAMAGRGPQDLWRPVSL